MIVCDVEAADTPTPRRVGDPNDANDLRSPGEQPGDGSDLAAVGDQVVDYQGSHENGVAADTVDDSTTNTPGPRCLHHRSGKGFDRTMVPLDDHRLVLLDLGSHHTSSGASKQALCP